MGTSKRVDTPLITINIMVRVGPWTVEEVVYGHWRKCDRCGTDHKEVWVCTIDPEVDEAAVQARLEGRRTWRVGSTCGPTLELASEAAWAEPAKNVGRIVQLAVDATHVLTEAEATGVNHMFLPWIVENLEKLKHRQLDRRMQKILRSHVSAVRKEMQHARRSAS